MNQQGGILAQIQLLPKELQLQLMQAFAQWAQLKGIDIKQLLQDLNALEQALGLFMQELQSQQTQSAKHGAKLQYLKSLKHQCAEDEELYYFKKGGSVRCECRKKGGEVEKAKEGAVAKFKKMLAGNKLDPKTTKKLPNGKYPSNWTSHDRQVWERENGSGDEGAATVSGIEHKQKTTNKQTTNKQSNKTLEKKIPRSNMRNEKIMMLKNGSNVVKAFKEKCGAKLKKHQLGGSLNHIPFMLKGTSKGGLSTAPKAEDRYKKGRIVWNTPWYKEVSSASNIYGDPFASKIAMEVSNNGSDTTFYETPGRWLPVKFKTRIAKSTNKVYKPILVSDDGFKSYRVIGIDPEYEILKRRFNTAWNLVK